VKNDMADHFKLLSDPTRLEIIELLLKGETCGCTLIDKITVSQPTLSYHLKLLSDGGLAHAKRDKNRILYTIDRSRIEDMIRFLNTLKNADEPSCAF